MERNAINKIIFSAMRQSICKVVSCHDQSLPASQKYVEVQLLTGETLNFVVDAKSTGQELFDQVCDSLKLNDAKLFGLALLIDCDFHFLDLSLKVSKYAPKSWKAVNENDLNRTGIPSVVFHFRVQFYIDCHLLVRDRIARYHYYLQLRENVIRYGQALSEERTFFLVALALQADWGNYNVKKHCSTYFDPKKYFPDRVINKMGYDYIIEHTPSLHKDNFGLSRGEAQLLYIKESSDPNSSHNLHLYKLNKKKVTDSSMIWLGISFSGIHFYEYANIRLSTVLEGPIVCERENNFSYIQEINSCIKRHISLFHWADISKLYFDKRKFEIRSGGCPEPRKFTYYTTSDELSKKLFWLCRATHQFSMFIEPQVKELQRRDSAIIKNYRESYIYSSCRELAIDERKRKGYMSNTIDCSSSFKKEGSSGSDHCVSIISSASSNTTSGIVSDKMQCLDESEDDLELDFIAPLPPSQLLDLSKDEAVSCESVSLKQHQASKSTDSLDLSCVDDKNDITLGDGSIEYQRSRWHSEPACFRNSDTCLGCDAHFSSLSDVTKLSHPCVESNVNLRKYKCEDLHCCDKLHSDMHLNDKYVKTKNIFLKHPCISSHDNYVRQFSESSCKPTGCIHAEKSSHCAVNLHYHSGNSNNSLYRNEVQKHPSSCQDILNCDSNRARTGYFSSQNAFLPHYHARTMTKIGVSSLTRLHGFPLNYFGSGSIAAASSEPSLYNSATYQNYANGIEIAHEMSSLPTVQKVNAYKTLLGNYNNLINTKLSKECKKVPGKHLWESNPCLSALYCKDHTTVSLPPSASTSCFSIEHSQKSGIHNFQSGDFSDESRLRLGSLPALPLSSKDLAVNQISTSSFSTSLDFHQLHQKRDMDLPFISALCNDRSLLMLPKTVPTCTWQRHMGKDLRRFSCSAVFSPSCENFFE